MYFSIFQIIFKNRNKIICKTKTKNSSIVDKNGAKYGTIYKFNQKCAQHLKLLLKFNKLLTKMLGF